MSLLQLTKNLALILAVGSMPVLAKDAQKSCEHRTFNIKIGQTVNISELVNQMADMCHFSVITKDIEAQKLLQNNLNGINIKKMSLYEVFDLILDENGINYTYAKNTLKLSALNTKTFKIDYISSVREGTANITASVDVEVTSADETKDDKDGSDNEIKVKEKFDFWSTLSTELKAIVNNGSESYIAKDPIINTNTGLVTVTATKTQLNRVEKYLDELKSRLHKQVLIDVSIVAVELSNDYTSGINWSKFSLSLNSDSTQAQAGASTSSISDAFSNVANNVNVINKVNFSTQGLMNFIQQRGNGKVISSPKIMTLNNQQALITIGDNINYRIQEDTSSNNSDNQTTTYTPYSVFIGVLLNLLPEVSDDNKIMLRINPSLSNFKYAEDNQKQLQPREIAPDTLEKKLSTVVRVNSGDTIILGGLIGQTKGKDKTNVPLLSDLPIVGGAFRSTSDSTRTTELVFVITPYIVNPDKSKQIGTSLKDLGFSESLYE